MENVTHFLNDCREFFLATVDGDQPKVRPLGMHANMDGKVLFGIGDFKEVYKQLLANPKCEIAGCRADGHWIRYTGKAVFEEDEKYAEAMLEEHPQIKYLYQDGGHKLMVFHLEDAVAVEIAIMGEGESLINE